MVYLKTSEEIAIMREAGLRLKRVLKLLLPTIKPGITTEQIDREADKLIKKEGGEPSFKRVKNYRWATCLPINEQVVHTPPSKRVINKGDILTVDIGLYLGGFHTDYATTFIVGESEDKKLKKFLAVGQSTLDKAIDQAGKSRYIGEISRVIQKEIYGNGYFILKELTGHGIGRQLHEDPFVPGFLDRSIEKTYKIRKGLAIAIEIIYSAGTEEIRYEKGSDWSITTADGSISACFEKTIAWTEGGIKIITED